MSSPPPDLLLTNIFPLLCHLTNVVCDVNYFEIYGIKLIMVISIKHRYAAVGLLYSSGRCTLKCGNS